MEAMAVLLVAVQNMDVEALAGLGIDDGPRNATVPRRLVDVRGNELGFVRYRIVRIEILAKHQGVETCLEDLAGSHAASLVSRIKHTVAQIGRAACRGRE